MSPPSLAALVLAAGLGTRLRPLTSVRAKAAAPVDGIPLIGRVLTTLARRGVERVVVNLHHLPHTITRLVGDGSPWHVEVRYSFENPLLGSAGGPRHALPLLDTDPFLIVNGDTLCDIDLAALAQAHHRHGARVTMAVVPNTEPERYGGVLVAADGSITGFTHKGDRQRSWHFVGLQVANRDVFDALPDGVPAESVSGVYRRLLADAPDAVRAWCCDTPFHDIGTARQYLTTACALASADGRDGPRLGERTRVAPHASLVRSILWDDVEVERGSELTDCVVADGVHVPPATRLTGCMLVAEWAGGSGSGVLPLGNAVAVPIPGLYRPLG